MSARPGQQRCRSGLPAFLGLAIVLLPLVSPLDLARTEESRPIKASSSTIRTLEFSKVVLIVRTNDELHGHLTQLALAELSKAGVRPAAARSPEVRAGLVLTLKEEPLADCPGKVLFESGIELWEDVVLPRDPELSFEAVTWSIKRGGGPHITDEKDTPALETELKWYIRKFADHYNAFSAHGAR